MYRSHQALIEFVFTVARGDADVFGYAARKRMHAFVKAAGSEIKAEQLHDAAIQFALRRNCKWRARRNHWLSALFLLSARDKTGQPLPHIGKQPVDVSSAHAWLKPVHESIVAAEARVVREVLSFLASDAHHVAKIFEETLPVIRLALKTPRMLAFRASECLRFDERFRQCVGVAPVTPDLAQVRSLGFVEWFLFGGLEPYGELRVRARAMNERV